MKKIFNKIINFLNFKLKFIPLLLTLITVSLAINSFNANDDYSAIVGVLRFVVVFSAVLTVLFFHYVTQEKKEFSSLFNQAFVSLLLGILSLLIVKTMFEFGYVPYLIITISVYLFFSILVDLVSKVKSKE